MPLNLDHLPRFRRKLARAIQFDENQPPGNWPEGVVRAGKYYTLFVNNKGQALTHGDVIVYEGMAVTVMSSSEFEATFEYVHPLEGLL